MKKKILIVVSDYYKDISNSLLNSAKLKLKSSFTNGASLALFALWKENV